MIECNFVQYFYGFPKITQPERIHQEGTDFSHRRNVHCCNSNHQRVQKLVTSGKVFGDLCSEVLQVLLSASLQLLE